MSHNGWEGRVLQFDTSNLLTPCAEFYRQCVIREERSTVLRIREQDVNICLLQVLFIRLWRYHPFPCREITIETLVSELKMDFIQVVCREHRSNPVRGEGFSVDCGTMHLKKVTLLQELFHGWRRPSLVDVLGGEVIRQV